MEPTTNKVKVNRKERVFFMIVLRFWCAKLTKKLAGCLAVKEKAPQLIFISDCRAYTFYLDQALQLRKLIYFFLYL